MATQEMAEIRGIAYSFLSFMSTPFRKTRQLLCRHAWISAGMSPGLNGHRISRRRCLRCDKEGAVGL